MKSLRPVMKNPLWRGLISLRLTVILLIVLIALFVTGALLASRVGQMTPEVRYFLQVLGLTDVFRSGWFVFIQILLGLNLVALCVDRLPGVWRQAMQKAPPSVSLDQLTGSRRDGKYVYFELPCSIHREEFREIVVKWCRGRIGKPHVLRDEGGFNELQLAAQEGRYSRVTAYAGHLALIAIAVGVLISRFSGFEGRIVIDEGKKVDFMEVFRGDVREWMPLTEGGRPIPGFYKPGFEVESTRLEVTFYEGTDLPERILNELSFREQGKRIASQVLEVNRPIRFKDHTFYLMGVARTGQMDLVLKASDRSAEHGEKSLRIGAGESSAIGNSRFRVLQIRDFVEDMGASAQIEYVEGTGEPERFWIFQNYPAYDSVHRKKSRFTFALESVQPKYSSSILVTRDPGVPLVAGGALLLIFSLAIALTRAHNRYWFIWFPGRVAVVGWSTKLFFFTPGFERSMERFKGRLGKVDKSVRAKAIEVKYG